MAEPTAPHPLVERLRRVIKAHPVLGDQKKLEIAERGGTVFVEGVVFTNDMVRQLRELVARLPGGEDVVVRVGPEVSPPQAREVQGRVPDVSPGPSNVRRDYSTAHLERPRRR